MPPLSSMMVGKQADRQERSTILHLFCEEQSIRAIIRGTGASKNTVAKLLSDAGAGHVKKGESGMNVRRSLLRLWLVLFALWFGYCA